MSNVLQELGKNPSSWKEWEQWDMLTMLAKAYKNELCATRTWRNPSSSNIYYLSIVVKACKNELSVIKTLKNPSS